MRIALLLPDAKNWTGPSRGQLFERVLVEAGHTVAILPISGDQCPTALSGYDVVCNHALQAPPAKVRRLAEANPETQFIHVNHSATAHIEKNPRYIDRMCDAIQSARSVSNVWYGTQEATPIAKATGVERAVHLPTPGHMPMVRPEREPNRPAVVVIAGRPDSIKNNLNQLLAVGLLGKEVELHLCMEQPDWLRHALRAFGIDAVSHGMMPHGKWLRFLADKADVCLQCSLAESFNYVASEAMQTGVPTVTGGTIRFADPNLVANPNRPESIAEAVRRALNEYTLSARQARMMASQCVAECQRTYLAAIERIASTCCRTEDTSIDSTGRHESRPTESQ